MRLGIVADIHGAVEPLRNALAGFRRVGVEQVVSLGDAFEFPGSNDSVAVAGLLRDAGACGVWGNHDVGLSHEITDVIRSMSPPTVLEFASRLRPQLVIDNCHFSHNEPWLDHQRIENLWYFDGPPEKPERVALSFNAVREQFLFMGHLHEWVISTRHGRVAWKPQAPLVLERTERYLVVVHALLHGWCATFDTIRRELTPIWCG